MKHLKLLELDETLSDESVIVDDNVFPELRRYDWYLSRLTPGIFRKRHIRNNGKDTIQRIYLSKTLLNLEYGEYTGFSPDFSLGFKNGNPYDYRKNNWIIFDDRKHRTTIWNPADHHINPHILN